ncbi:MAG: hypothetical protein Q8P90_05170 [bacterium]|nr:hypothetical protein [bacterium]
MPKINLKQLINLPVYTETDYFLGNIVDADLSIDDHVIVKYYVGKNKLVDELLKNIIGSSLLSIAPSQVVSITVDRMIVMDAVLPSEVLESEIEATEVGMPATASAHQRSN